jgi:phosphonoacetate hydrolase
MIEVNHRRYAVPKSPRAIVCLDGSDPAYLDDVLRSARVPTLARFTREGTFAIVNSVVPTFTNPNNVSIVTGAPPAVHGISGNHFFDRAANADVPMNERSYLRAPTILEALQAKGVRVLSVTAKHKLVKLIGAEESAFSAENPGELGRSLVPDRAAPDVYSADASLWVLDAGAAALERGLADVVYLSTTDYVQHKHAPGAPEARAFYEAIDLRLARIERTGAVVALTADHGMNDKTKPDGSPNVVYLASLLDRALGPGTRVTLPITDPYVVHHGALGSCAMIYTSDRDPKKAQSILESTPGIDFVLPRSEAAARYALPPDRIGDLIVLSSRSVVLGKHEEEHDLSHVERGLRSHGGLHEVSVPLILNRRLEKTGHEPRWNYDVFELALSSP